MGRGKLIIIEGTDCSGKETQSNKLVERLIKDGKKVFKYSFPAYDTPTGRIIGGPYLGKPHICEGWFPEKAPAVDPLVACAYYAADRRYNIGIINEHLDKGHIVIIDRYVESNMAHQGGKLKTKEERKRIYKKLHELEYGFMELPKPDMTILLYMPCEYAKILKETRTERADQHESTISHLKNAEAAYLELAEMYKFTKINCVKNDAIRSIDDIHEDVYQTVIKFLK